MRRGYILSLVTLWGVLGCKGILCTSQNLHMLLRHPHYAEGHQHALQNHLGFPTPFPSRKVFDARTSYVPPHHSSSSPTSTRVAEEAPWQRVGPITKDYYKMNHLKGPSASLRTIVEPPMPQELLEVREANEHFVRMRSGARCHQPRAEVVCVRDVYPDKEFLPRCTLLHRCSETAGCCENDTLQCGPKAMQEVVLHFYVLGGDHKSSNVEKLLFVNHTECECQPKPAEEIPVSIETTTATSSISTTISSSASSTESAFENDVDHFPQRDQKSPKCRPCPSPFCVRELELGRCSCDCFDKHKPCIRVKRGREALGDAERRCVQSGQCNIPDCDYGGFDPDKGRCPRRPDHDTFKGGRPHPNHRNPNHRWTYFERD